jgi:hypothetical protein
MDRLPRFLTAAPVLVSGMIFFVASGFAACRDVTVEARGAEKSDIEQATASAGDALSERVARDHGRKWGVGSRRYGSFHCDRILAGRKPGWTCTARTTAICAR